MTVELESADLRVGPADWLRVAGDLADDLATDAAARDRSGRPPLDEVDRLREAGLLTLLTPAELGGGGGDWRTACAVVRTVAAADGVIGQLLGRHYFLAGAPRFFADPARAERLEREAAAERWLWGGGISAHEPPLTLTPDSGGAGTHLLDGHLPHVAGAGHADRLVVRAVRAATGEPLAVLVDPARPGIRRLDGDVAPERVVATDGGVEFNSVPVDSDDVLGSLLPDDDVLSPFARLAAPAARLVSAHFCLGVAEGLLAEVREYERGLRAPWQPFTPETRITGARSHDAHALTVYGELAVSARAASALTEQSVAVLTRALDRGEDLEDEECAEAVVLAGAAEAAASRAAQDITTRALDGMGIDAVSPRYGFDRFWRSARGHALREPVAHRLREVGDYFLNGAHPPFTLPA
ncbi:Dibenzothiophene desulfurization enzyme C [Streptomyces sp. YIM 130001]|uniref:acyl-CoA dehydrogenase family protein n=1 Tax=Streptomyces sp. YIM 130001 TaxID=2259644 RepID=UPI000E64ED8B|nr:acyl-CoA dehydrogenase family protein [Streptomyces sp. YIM 130001]RII09361.1 Dibenzothiophene desulfurization enzyme C [Streptomyces sp. YIM 130001]